MTPDSIQSFKVALNQANSAANPSDRQCLNTSQTPLGGVPTGKRKKVLLAFCLGLGLLGAMGCNSFPKESAEAQSQRPGGEGRGGGATPVDVAIARSGLLRQQPDYTGTTEPVRSVLLRSQVEGQLLALNVDVGDTVKQGQIVGQLDDSLLRTALNQAEAELAALKSEVAQANTRVSNARAEVERLRLELEQAKADAQRQQVLLKEGAIAAQAAEQAQTAARTAAQALRAAEEEVRTEQQAVAAAKGRVVAQEAVIAEANKRRGYTRLISPISGVVLDLSREQRIKETGDLVRPGEEILRLGDFNRVQVRVEVSEKELSKVRVGLPVQVRLDAFPEQKFIGQVTRISPSAYTSGRLVPVEVVIPNTEGQIGSGLMARVSFESTAQERVVVPELAIQGREGESRTGTVFVLAGEGETGAKVIARAVTLGQIADGKVEILGGLKPGERFVTRSGRPLKDGDAVRLSILSEKSQSKGQ